MSSSQTQEMITALPAPGPHASLGERARAFDRFVGTWDAECTEHAADGSTTRFAGQVLFGWIIDGWAVQDVWIWHPETGERGIGTTVRFYDAKAGAWRVVWICPAEGVLVTLTGGPVGDRIVLRGERSGGGQLRWSFNEIRADSFVWRGEVSHDQGETWRLTGEYHMRRRVPAVR